jgi:hypothetical protein
MRWGQDAADVAGVLASIARHLRCAAPRRVDPRQITRLRTTTAPSRSLTWLALPGSLPSTTTDHASASLRESAWSSGNCMPGGTSCTGISYEVARGCWPAVEGRNAAGAAGLADQQVRFQQEAGVHRRTLGTSAAPLTG